MKVYKPLELADKARQHSPFYREAYKNLPPQIANLQELPIVDEHAFWSANTIHNNQVHTSRKLYGVLLKTGGSTSAPKVSVFSQDEWKGLAQILSAKHIKNKFIKDGDRVVNLFTAGDLYGSLLLNHNALLNLNLDILQLPFSSNPHTPLSEVVHMIKELNGNVLMGIPYRLMQIFSYIKENNIKDIQIDTVLYGGDLMLPGQANLIREMYPHALITSSGYASTDSGFLGFPDRSCNLNEYRSDPELTTLEIIDDQTGLPIEEPFKEGRLIATNLTRMLSPVIRYPVGDRAQWLESKEIKNRKFALVGRHTIKDDKINLGNHHYDYNDFLMAIFSVESFKSNLLGIEINFSTKNDTKKITMKIAMNNVSDDDLESVANKIKQTIRKCLPTLNASEKNKELEPLEVTLIKSKDIVSIMKYVARTYKAVKVTKD